MNPETESIRLVLYLDHDGERRVTLPEGSGLRVVKGVKSIYDPALEAVKRRSPLAAVATERVGDMEADYDVVSAARWLLPPLYHPNPAHCLVSGTRLAIWDLRV